MSGAVAVQVFTEKPVTAAIGRAGVRHGNIMIQACKESPRALDQGRYAEQPCIQHQPPPQSLPWDKVSNPFPQQGKITREASHRCVFNKKSLP